MKRIDTQKEKWIVRRYLAGMPATQIATHQQISTRVVNKKVREYKKYGEDFFEIQPKGRRKQPISNNFKLCSGI